MHSPSRIPITKHGESSCHVGWRKSLQQNVSVFAYQQLELDEKSQQYLTINTHKGLFKYHRLAYGISTAPAIFQHTMDQILQGLPHVVCFTNDILVSAPTVEEHLMGLDKVLSRLQQYGVRLNESKCKFFCSSVE